MPVSAAAATDTAASAASADGEVMAGDDAQRQRLSVQSNVVERRNRSDRKGHGKCVRFVFIIIIIITDYSSHVSERGVNLPPLKIWSLRRF